MKTKLVLMVLILVGYFPLYAEESGDDLKLSLDKLFSLKVTSVSGTAMDMKKSPAAIYVITNEDMKRQGHLNIADALKAVPGFHVTKTSSNKWSISSRGFNSNFANKLLVLIDGRSVYTPLFAGVYWEIQDMVLEDIDRIEVIRGPGATLWGANAVNGVINIVTKGARETQGGHAKIGYGNEDKGFGEIRWGDQIDDDLFYRLSYKKFERDDYQYTDGREGIDSWNGDQFNLRTDWYVTAKDTITTIANYQEYSIAGLANGVRDPRVLTPPPFVPAPPVTVYSAFFDEASEAKWKNRNFQMEWNRAITSTEGFTLKSYYDVTDNKGSLALEERRDTFDIDFRHWFNWDDANSFIWGLNFRTTEDHLHNTETTALIPDEERINSYSMFLQNTTQLNNQWALMVGSKIGYNDQTEVEVQPSVRMTYEHSPDTTFWASWSRAVRTPARTDDNLRLRIGAAPASIFLPPIYGAGPGDFLPASIVGDPDTQSEELLAYEMGMRQDYWDKKVSLDLAVFYNDYSRVSDFDSINSGSDLLLERLDDDTAESYGVEASIKYKATEDLDFMFNYTWFRIFVHGTSEGTENNTPDHILFTQMNYQLLKNVSWHTTALYSDHISGRGGIHSYITLDSGVIWNINSQMDFAVWGKNLLDPQQSQYNEATFSDTKSEVPRSVFAEFTYRF